MIKKSSPSIVLKNCTIKPQKIINYPQPTKQDIEDLDQLLEMECTDKLRPHNKKVWDSKGEHNKSIEAIHDNSGSKSGLDVYKTSKHGEYYSEHVKYYKRHILRRQNLSFCLMDPTNNLSRNLHMGGNLRRVLKIKSSDKQSNHSPLLPVISKTNESTNRTKNKESLNKTPILKLRSKKASKRVLRMTKKFNNTLEDIDRELQNNDCLEAERRKLVLSKRTTGQLQLTEMLLNEIILEDPKFINNLHEYKQQSVTRFIEDRKNIKDRLYSLLIDPNRIVGRLERQGVIRRKLLKKKRIEIILT